MILLVIFERLQLAPDTCAEVLQCIHTQGSLLALGGAPEELIAFLRILNEDTWFVVDGAEVVTQSMRGARPGETIADLVFNFPCATIAQEVLSIIGNSEFHQSLGYCNTGFLDAGPGLDSTIDQLEAMYADDATHGVLHVFAKQMWSVAVRWLPMPLCFLVASTTTLRTPS
jgi:hypothetical protein